MGIDTTYIAIPAVEAGFNSDCGRVAGSVIKLSNREHGSFLDG